LERKRARDLGIAPGILPTGKMNTITDVKGVRVGHFTLIKGEDIRTGATAILPHKGNLYQERIPASIVVGNGHGKLVGATQIWELGEIETPIVLTNTLSVYAGAEAILDWTLEQKGNEKVRTVNPVVGETNDGRLSNIRLRSLTPDMILKAINCAREGAVPEGSVGAGTGTVCFGWKGGIGTSSRVIVKKCLGKAYTVGVLVQSNFGGVLQILGVRVGEKLGKYYMKDDVSGDDADGSVMMVVATDAPLSDRNLERLAKRALSGLARTGASMTNGSGDYVIAFSTALELRRTLERRGKVSLFPELPNKQMSPLFQAVAEATEEAIYNSLFMAKTTKGFNGIQMDALPLEKIKELVRER